METLTRYGLRRGLCNALNNFMKARSFFRKVESCRSATLLKMISLQETRKGLRRMKRLRVISRMKRFRAWGFL